MSNVPNLDAMSEEELAVFWKNHSSGRNVKRLFPEGGKGTVTAVRALANYAANKQTAMRCRARGDIQTALMYEGICDRIYNEMPEIAYW